MDSFNFFFGFYGLLLGFSVAVVTRALATIVSRRTALADAVLPCLVGAFMILDLIALWVLAWDFREFLGVNYPSLYMAAGIAIIYYFAAVIAFPEPLPAGEGLTAAYWANKRVVVAAILLTGLFTFILSVSADPGILRDPIWWTAQALIWPPLVLLLVSRSKRLDLLLWAVLVLGYAGEAALELFIPAGR
jgi:hypothetical protein